LTGKKLSVGLVLVLLTWLVLNLRHDGRRLQASRLLQRAETMTLGALSAGPPPRLMLTQNLRDLRRARKLDPQEVGIPIALGSQFLLLQSPQAAMEAYEEALALAPRPEAYLNLGKAQQMAGDLAAARKSYALAVALDPRLAREVPPELR
jgi:tetratricopeptide (TPR) repeat protein